MCLQTLWPYFTGFYRFWVFFWAGSLQNELGDFFVYISDITNSSFFNVKISRKKSMLEKFRANVLKVPSTHIQRFLYPENFYADTQVSASTRSIYESYTTVHMYLIRIRTSQRISQQSMRITEKTFFFVSTCVSLLSEKNSC